MSATSQTLHNFDAIRGPLNVTFACRCVRLGAALGAAGF